MTKALTTSAEAEREAERLRRDLIGTLDRLLDNLAPRRLASEAFEATRARTPDRLKAYWAFAQGPVGLGLVGAAAAGIAVGLVARRRSR